MLRKGWKKVLSDRELSQWSWTVVVFAVALILLVAGVKL